MNLLLSREPTVDGCTMGQLFANGEFLAWTLEDPVRDGPKIAHETAIPPGTYEVIINRSQRFHRLLPLLLKVPEFDGVRIHPGNVAADTSGCILVGRTRGVRSVLYSNLAMGHVQAVIAAALAQDDRVYIQVMNAPTAPVTV